MKILVMSDSHGLNDMIDYVLETEKNVDMYIHCGDICVREEVYPQLITVRGNNDYHGYPLTRILEVCGHRIYVTHSHRFPYYDKQIHLAKAAKENNCDIVCFGHTHVAYEGKEQGVTLLNPGSLFMSRNGKPVSYAILTIDKNGVKTEIKYLENEKLKKKFWFW